MQEENDGTKFLIVLLLITFLAGAMVLVLKSDYRFRDNSLSNLEYYPNVKIDKGTD
ncbi:MAG TPA: hypothetical protein PLM07_21240 [Candidatus Rifleibacterium sp.]|nr:hypothetical protein [Candidatus Rifleibacterium sp.]HPT48418.1 hypothetical protein [Candidatus Rifleibacterium sp.]